MRPGLWVLVALWVAGILFYSNSLNNGFLIDDYVFLGNPVFSSTKYLWSQWDPYQQQALGVVDNHDVLGYYRPLTHMFYDWSYETFKSHFYCYHLLNLVFFVAASFLIYLLLEKMTGNIVLAFFSAFFYLIHPINGIVVNYISASVFAFQAIFTLGAILLLIESLERKNHRPLYFLSLFFCFLSLFWNESGIMTPFYICVTVLLFVKEPIKKKLLCICPYFLIVLAYVLFRIFFISLNQTFFKHVGMFHLSTWEYIGNLFRVYSWYISQLINPQGVVMAWAVAVVHDHVFWYVLQALILMLLVVVLAVRFAKIKVCQWALIWLLIGFAPVCLAAFRRPDDGVQIEPHWFIISSIGFFVLAAYFLSFLVQRSKAAGFFLIAVLVFFWGGISHANNRIWVDQKTYALYWVQQDPDLKSAYFYAADAYQKQGNMKEARRYYQLALAGYPSDLEIYNNLGAMDEQEGHWSNAELNFQKVIKINAFSAAGYYNLGTVDLHQGLWHKALMNFDRAIGLNPFFLEARRALASLFFQRGDYKKAIRLCMENLQINERDTQTSFLLAKIFLQEGDWASLNKYALRSIQSEDDPAALDALGNFWAANKAYSWALACFQKAARVDPHNKDAYLDAGLMFVASGQKQQALRIWQEAAALFPSDQLFPNYMARIKAGGRT